MRVSLRFMLKYLKEKHWLFWGYLALFLESSTPVVAAILQKDLIDKVFVNKEYEVFTQLLVLYGVFFFGPKLWFSVRKVVFFRLAYSLRTSLTKVYIEKVYSIPSKLRNEMHVGTLQNHLRSDIADASDIVVNQILSELVYVVLSVLLLSMTIAVINIYMLVVAIFISSAYYVLLNKFDYKTKQYAVEVRKEKGALSQIIEEYVASIREILAFNREEWQMNRYLKAFNRYYSSVWKEGLYKLKILFISEPLLYITKLIVIIIGVLTVIGDSFSFGEFIASYTLVDLLVTSLGQLFKITLVGKRLVGPVNNLRMVLEAEDRQLGTQKIHDKINELKFENVSFRYSPDTEMVIDNMSVDFPIGKKIAIVGESGSGKSTIAQLILRLVTPDVGVVTLNGIPISDYSDCYTDKISAVFQSPHLIPSSIEENLTFGHKYSTDEIEFMCKQMICHDFILDTPMGYKTNVGERGTKLSGGQKQRIALSRALLKNTEILILDEATSALDTVTESAIQESIDKIRKGKTTIIIAHRLSTILNADIIYLMEGGRITSFGSHNDLISSNATYRELYEYSCIT